MSKTFYRTRLPHIQPEGFSFFVTFRLAGSIPKEKLQSLVSLFELKYNSIVKNENGIGRNISLARLRNKYLLEYDKVLDQIKTGPHYLKQSEIASIIAEQLTRFDGEFYDLISYCIMSNHVHLLLDLSVQFKSKTQNEKYKQLDEILHRIKGATARYCNLELNRSGQFWARESYDIYIRDGKMLENVISYILENPVKAGVVENWEEFEWSYVKIQ